LPGSPAFSKSGLFVEGAESKRGDLALSDRTAAVQAQVDDQQANRRAAGAQHRNAQLTLERSAAAVEDSGRQQSNSIPARLRTRAGGANCRRAGPAEDRQINLGYTEIRAPIDGRITSTAVTEGNVVSPTTGTLANLGSQDPMY